MTLDEAYDVAKAVADCADPAVTRDVFKNLSEAFPDFKFELDRDILAGGFTVAHISGVQRQGNIWS